MSYLKDQSLQAVTVKKLPETTDNAPFVAVNPPEDPIANDAPLVVQIGATQTVRDADIVNGNAVINPDELSWQQTHHATPPAASIGPQRTVNLFDNGPQEALNPMRVTVTMRNT